MIKCPYCDAENPDGEIFCEECGRPLKRIEKKKKKTEKYSQDVNGNLRYNTGCPISAIDGLNDVLIFPISQYKKGEYTELIFEKHSGCTLAKYLKQQTFLERKVLVEIEERILDILGRLQEQKKILGSCSLEDFFLVGNEVSEMKLFLVRPLLEKGVTTEKYECGEVSAPEIRNQDWESIDKRTDVYLAAILFGSMMIGDKYIEKDFESQIFWAYYDSNLTMKKEYAWFHYWLGNGLSMFPSKRMRDIEECRIAFKVSSELDIVSPKAILKMKDALETKVGDGKKAVMMNSGRPREEWNEDVIEKWEDTEKNLTAYLLADGISNCAIGSGYKASNLIRKNFRQILEEYQKYNWEENEENLIQDIIYKIITASNRDIWDERMKMPGQTGSIMGSTFLFLLTYKGKLYFYSLGDSVLYMIRKGNLIPLNSPDNAGYFALKNGKSYAEYQRMEEKERLVLYVGGEYSRNQTEYYKKRKTETIILQDGDMILASSDGIIDYFGTRFSDTLWEKEILLTKKLNEKDKTIERKVKSIVKRDNENGGGDNLSVILIEAGGR